jgi:hypothetical protein
MARAVAGLAAAGLIMGSTAAGAESALMYVTPQNIKDGTFRVTSKASRNNTVEFVIRRDIRNIREPSRKGYLSNPAVDGSTLGTPVKLEQGGKTWRFRFSVPADRVAGSVFTLWGAGMPSLGEGVTYRFRLAEFWRPGKA